MTCSQLPLTCSHSAVFGPHWYPKTAPSVFTSDLLVTKPRNCPSHFPLLVIWTQPLPGSFLSSLTSPWIPLPPTQGLSRVLRVCWHSPWHCVHILVQLRTWTLTRYLYLVICVQSSSETFLPCSFGELYTSQRRNWCIVIARNSKGKYKRVHHVST